jgi:hypothetical protein
LVVWKNSPTFVLLKQTNMNHHNVTFRNSIFTCKPFFDLDTNANGIDIYDENNNRIGEMMNIDIPDETDAEAVKTFETKVLEFIDKIIW